jgi:cytochrome c oxidase assembly protein subunit 15
MLHLFAMLVAATSVIMMFAGGLVSRTESGFSVPYWPYTYGYFMFFFPLEKMVGGIRYEHTHRLIASTVGFLIVILAAWLWRAETRRWVRRLGYLALAAVITQGILGGITVLWYLPDPISIAHASLAQIVFCLTMTIALVTSPGWKRAYATQEGIAPKHSGRQDPSPDDLVLQRVAAVTTGLIYLQIVVGATMRHTGAGLAIPDFPLMFGQLIPPHWDPKIAIHFAHRLGAVIVSLAILATTGHVFYHHKSRSELLRPALLLLALLVTQVTLGAMTVLSQKEFIINSLHVITGASVLVTSLVLTLRAHRARFAAGSKEQDPAYGRPMTLRRAGSFGPANSTAGDHA